MIKLLVFLGNPGKEFENTRHNAGYMLFDYLYGGISLQNKFHSLFGKNEDFFFLKPLSGMNNSGIPTSECASFFRFKNEEIVVFHDDSETPFSRGRIIKGEPLHGHKGLRSIKERLGNSNFYHVSLGIGKPVYGNLRQFVLSPFLKDEIISLLSFFDKLKPYIKKDIEEITLI